MTTLTPFLIGFVLFMVSYEFEPLSWQDVLDATLCDKVCQRFVAGRCFSLGTPGSSTNKTDHHDIFEILLKVAFSTIKMSNTDTTKNTVVNTGAREYHTTLKRVRVMVLNATFNNIARFKFSVQVL
jgi:hypothetical protein